MSQYKQTISSKTYFHFTKSFDRLRSILDGGFRPNYCSETVHFSTYLPDEELAIPMVCFCDLPLSMAKNHIRDYGKFGVAMKKDWGLKNKLSPISYVQPNGRLKEKLEIGFQNFKRFERKTSSPPTDTELHALNGFKEFEFQLYLMKSNDFYDEREWRYVPASPEIHIVKSATKKKTCMVVPFLNTIIRPEENLKDEIRDLWSQDNESQYSRLP